MLLCLALWAAAPHRAGGEELQPLEPADTTSPRATLNSFRTAGREVYDYIREHEGRRSVADEAGRLAALRLLSCLDLSETPQYLRASTAKRSAVCLLEVLDRIELPPEEKIPFGPADEDAADFEPPPKWRIDHTEIVIQRVSEGPRAGEYLFSPETVARAPEFYKRVEHLPYKQGASEDFYQWYLSEPGVGWLSWVVHRLPAWTRQRVFGQAVWQWVGLLLTIVAGLALMLAAYRTGRRNARRIGGARWLRRLITLWAPLVALLAPVAVRWISEYVLAISGATLAVVTFGASVVFLIGVMVLIVSVGNRIADILIASPRIHPGGIDAQFIRVICRVLSLVVATIVFLEGGKYLGIPLTTLLAGAGVGGLTIALAAQDTLRNLFGSMMILLDKPFRVGERIVAKGYDGVVQEIGLRSTKLRLLTGHEATIPNDELAKTDVENIGRRLHIRRVADLALPIDLPPEKCEQAVSIVRELLADHEGMDEQFPPRVFLNEFNRDSLNLRFFYWYHPPNYWDFLAFSERLNLQIKRRFADTDIPLALPTGKTVLAREDEQPPEAHDPR